MKRSNFLPELLAPAGSFECLVAAVEAGADAVYVGGKRFGARAYAKNFDTDELTRAISYCHLHGVKLYVTVNTLIEDKEFPELIEYAKTLYRIGTDALIIADLGAISQIKKYVPELELHASTQMSVHNSIGADEAASLGCKRVVPARELSLSDIKALTEKCIPEVEVFLHGALCVCHSGQCLFSSLVGGRSGNRGECAQPCRLPYNGKYPLSLKDLSLAAHIRELIDSGVASLKIEGRMKSPDYVYTVTRIYRTLLDEGRNATPKEHDELRRAFSRGGFTDGYFIGRPDVPMTGMRSEADKQDSRESSGKSFEIQKIPASATVEIRLGKPSKMALHFGEESVEVTGATPSPAENSPLRESDVKARLSKMGNTFFELKEENIDLVLEEGVNLPPSAINALRRSAAEAASFAGKSLKDIPYNETHLAPYGKKNLITAVFFSEKAFLAAYDRSKKDGRDFDITFIPLTSSDPSLKKSNGIYIPPIITDHELPTVESLLSKAKNAGILYALVSNIGHIKLADKYGLTPIGDFRLNITNSHTARAYESLGIAHSILSPELTLPQSRDIGGGIIVYGRIPLMITERCFMKENFGCQSCSAAALTDRRGESFPIIREFEHRNLILNSAVTYIGDKKAELSKNRLTSYHFIFTTETAEEILCAIRSFKSGTPLPGAKNIRRIGRRSSGKQ